jgi:hypothetical protein
LSTPPAGGESTEPLLPPARDGSSPQASPRGSAPSLEGDLGQFFPSEVLQLLQLAQATGRLELTRPDSRAPGTRETVDVFFVAGRPVFAQTNGQSVRTGEILVHRGHVSRETLDAALDAQRREPGRRIGQVLKGLGAAAPEPVSQAVHEGLRRILYGVLLWREGRFRFLAGERAEDNDLPLDLDLDRLILEGLRLADQSRAGR